MTIETHNAWPAGVLTRVPNWIYQSADIYAAEQENIFRQFTISMSLTTKGNTTPTGAGRGLVDFPPASPRMRGNAADPGARPPDPPRDPGRAWPPA